MNHSAEVPSPAGVRIGGMNGHAGQPGAARFRPDRVEMDTPQGLLVVTWPRGQASTSKWLEPAGEDLPQDPGPTATLDGKPVSMDRARQVGRAWAAERARRRAHAIDLDSL